MENDNIKNQVLAAIQSGEVKQRSRRYFVLRGILIGTGLGLILIAILYLASFIFFILRQTGVWFAPTFGLRGWVSFLRSAPWLLIGLALAFVIVLEILVRRYAFAYQKPLAYSACGILVIALGGGFLLFETSFHQVLFGAAENRGLPPPIAAFYRGFGGERFGDIHPGMIIATTSGGFIFQEIDDEATETVIIAPDTQLPAQIGFAPSDTVVVFGPESGTFIHAVGIKEVGSDILWVAPPPPSNE